MLTFGLWSTGILGTLAVLGLLYILLSLRTVEAGSIGAVFRFGKFVRAVRPGLQIVLLFVEKLEVYSTQTHQDELPDEPEYVDRVNDNPEPGKVSPFRVLHRGAKEAVFYEKTNAWQQSLDPDNPLSGYREKRWAQFSPDEQRSMEEDSLHAPLTSEIAVAVEWYLDNTNTAVQQFVENVEPVNGRSREEEVTKRMVDMANRTLQELLGPVTLGHARDLMAVFSALIKLRLEELVGERGRNNKPWGIHIRDAYVKNIYPGRRVNEARANAAASVSNKQTTIRNAEAEAEATRQRAEAEAHQARVQADATAHATRVNADAKAHEETKKGEGEAGRIKAMAEVMKDDNAKWLAQLDVAEQVLPHVNATYLPIQGIIDTILSFGKKEERRIIP